MNYSRFVNNLSKKRKPSTIRSLISLMDGYHPDLIFLAGGLPNTKMFPFDSATFLLKDGTELKIDSTLMASALQYGPTSGYTPLLNHLKTLTKQLHSPPLWEETDAIVTAGSQDGLCKALEMLFNEKDYFITQEPCYTGTLSIVNPYEPNYIAVKGDEHGMIPADLRKVLAPWTPKDIKAANSGVPKILYVNPNANNPSGVSITEERKKEIYKIACDYDLLILEDDPYYFVQFDQMENYAPSFLRLDVEGRVLRFDSFSKILSSGMRVGFVTGPKPLIQAINLHMQVSSLHASSLAQVIVSKLLTTWKEEGFFKHISQVQEFYQCRRDTMVTAAEKYLSDLCHWSVPTGGMFLWLKVLDVEDTWDMVMKRGPNKNVILVPGRAFMTNDNVPCSYLRASFSVATPDQIELGMKYLSQLIREEIELQK